MLHVHSKQFAEMVRNSTNSMAYHYDICLELNPPQFPHSFFYFIFQTLSIIGHRLCVSRVWSFFFFYLFVNIDLFTFTHFTEFYNRIWSNMCENDEIEIKYKITHAIDQVQKTRKEGNQ